MLLSQSSSKSPCTFPITSNAACVCSSWRANLEFSASNFTARAAVVDCFDRGLRSRRYVCQPLLRHEPSTIPRLGSDRCPPDAAPPTSVHVAPLRTRPERVPDTRPFTCAASASPPGPEQFPTLKFPILPTSLLPFHRPLKVTSQHPGCLTAA